MFFGDIKHNDSNSTEFKRPKSQSQWKKMIKSLDNDSRVVVCVLYHGFFFDLVHFIQLKLIYVFIGDKVSEPELPMMINIINKNQELSYIKIDLNLNFFSWLITLIINNDPKAVFSVNDIINFELCHTLSVCMWMWIITFKWDGQPDSQNQRSKIKKSSFIWVHI